VPWRVGKFPHELHPFGCILGIKRVCIVDGDICIEQFVRIFVRIGCGRLGAAKVNCVLIARYDRVYGRILPRSQTLEAKLVLVICERAGNVGGEELRFDLTDHGSSVRQPLRDDSPAKPWALSWTAEEQNVAVRVANLETAQTVVCILKRCAECCAKSGKFGGKRIGVWCIDIGVPPHGGMAFGVRQGQYVFARFDEELRSVAADNGENRIPVRLLESRLETKLIAVEGDGLVDVADDEEWRNRLRVRSCHKHARFCCAGLPSDAPSTPHEANVAILSVLF